jgi:osmotically-inducible protein OsmY
MNRALVSPLFMAAMLALTGIVWSCGAKESDGDILTEISNRMHADPAMEGINARVVHGVVTLTGSCPDEPCRQHATKAMKDIDGVKEVVNNITLTTRPAP